VKCSLILPGKNVRSTVVSPAGHIVSNVAEPYQSVQWHNRTNGAPSPAALWALEQAHQFSPKPGRCRMVMRVMEDIERPAWLAKIPDDQCE
jgi:hypothetical protein